MLQVKQAPVQPLPVRGYHLPHASCCGQATEKRRKRKHVPATQPGEEQPQHKCQVLFLWSQSLHSDVVVVLPLGRAYLTNITSMFNQIQVEIPSVTDKWVQGKVRKLPTTQKDMYPCTYHPFIHAVTCIIHHEESLKVPSVGLSRQIPHLFALLFLK